MRDMAGPSDQIGYHIQVLILVWMSFQNALHTIFMRYSRSRKVEDMFLPSVAVFWSEVMKIVICVLIVCWEDGGVARGIRNIRKSVFENPMDTLKVCVPSFVYTISNNLNFVAATYLDAATFAIAAQLKLLTTAVFSVLILRRSLARMQWFSLLVLFAGVSLVQMPSSSSTKSSSAVVPSSAKQFGPGPAAGNNATAASASASSILAGTAVLGFSAAFMSAVFAGFAGVYFEKILKTRTTTAISKNEPEISVWMRNVQLAVSSVPIALVSAYVADGPVVRAHGLLYGFDRVVWLTVAWFSIGGLSVAVCIKYTDNIRKNFATSVAIILSTILSIYIFNFKPTLYFVSGAAMVIGALFMYTKSAAAPPQPPSSQLPSMMDRGKSDFSDDHHYSRKLGGGLGDNGPMIRVA